MALIEFGNRAYVITPFTSDYDNLLLSIALIGDPVEFSKFPDPGTIIGSAIEQSIAIFKAFDFLEASGNLMVIFTDGEDTNAAVNGRPLDDILKAATDNKIPLYFVRINFGKGFNEAVPDALWKESVEKAGGRFYIARDERSLMEAIADIDRGSAGRPSRSVSTPPSSRGIAQLRARGPGVVGECGRAAARASDVLDRAMRRPVCE